MMEGEARSRIRVFIDDTPLDVWPWTLTGDAVGWHSQSALARLRRGELRLVDGAGHPVGLDGQLQAGAHLYLREREEDRTPAEDAGPVGKTPAEEPPGRRVED
jgi:hypothetical protein